MMDNYKLKTQYKCDNITVGEPFQGSIQHLTFEYPINVLADEELYVEILDKEYVRVVVTQVKTRIGVATRMKYKVNE